MCALVDENRGSITIEMCFVMPIVVAVVMMLIMAIMRGVNEGNVLGAAQSMVYEYSDFETVVGEFALEAEGISYTYISAIKGSSGYSIEIADQNGEKVTIPLGE